MLVQTQGEIWRQIRNGPITVYGGWLVVIVTALIGLYYWRMGPLKLHKRPTGRLVERFTGWERAVHWLTAISFVVLALSGLVILFGKYILLPMFGYTLFSWLAILAKNLHNFIGPLFAVGTVLMFFVFVRDNFPKAHDWIWIKKGGGFFGAREHVPSGRFNAGEKSWFWLGVTLLGIVSMVTGFIMLFPNFAQGRSLMQLSNVIHAASAVLFIAMALAHIYVGTIGVEKAYETMRTGMADEIWAEEHHEYGYKEITKGRPGAAGSVSAARAGAMKEGWKL